LVNDGRSDLRRLDDGSLRDPSTVSAEPITAPSRGTHAAGAAAAAPAAAPAAG